MKFYSVLQLPSPFCVLFSTIVKQWIVLVNQIYQLIESFHVQQIVAQQVLKDQNIIKLHCIKGKRNIFNLNDLEALSGSCGDTWPLFGMLILYGKWQKYYFGKVFLVARMLDKVNLIVVFANYFSQVHRIFVLCFSCCYCWFVLQFSDT